MATQVMPMSRTDISIASHQIALADAVADRVVAQRSAELFAQGGDVDADGVAEAVHAVVPNVIHQLLLTHGPPLSVDSFSNSIRVHISALRKKLRAALGYDPIRNRIGEGYLMGGNEE